jgi:ATP-binding cassette subfamily B (MDR/TAP) protein 1
MFAWSGETLTQRLRSKAFHAILRQEIAYFDDPTNTTGALCTRLSTEASAVQGATGIRLGVICQNIAALGAGIIISFVFSWQLTLLVLGFVPFMIIGSFLEGGLMTGFAKNDKNALEDTSKVC